MRTWIAFGLAIVVSAILGGVVALWMFGGRQATVDAGAPKHNANLTAAQAPIAPAQHPESKPPGPVPALQETSPPGTRTITGRVVNSVGDALKGVAVWAMWLQQPTRETVPWPEYESLLHEGRAAEIPQWVSRKATVTDDTGAYRLAAIGLIETQVKAVASRRKMEGTWRSTPDTKDAVVDWVGTPGTRVTVRAVKPDARKMYVETQLEHWAADWQGKSVWTSCNTFADSWRYESPGAYYLEPRKYRVRAEAPVPGLRSAWTEFEVKAESPDIVLPLVLEETPRLEVVPKFAGAIPEEGVVVGCLTKTADAALPKAMRSVAKSGIRLFDEQKSNALFTIEGLTPGKHLVGVWARWDRLIATTTVHVDGHRQLVEIAVAEPPQADCYVLKFEHPGVFRSRRDRLSACLCDPPDRKYDDTCTLWRRSADEFLLEVNDRKRLRSAWGVLLTDNEEADFFIKLPEQPGVTVEVFEAWLDLEVKLNVKPTGDFTVRTTDANGFVIGRATSSGHLSSTGQPILRREVVAGRHSLVFTYEGDVVATLDITLVAGSNREIEIPYTLYMVMVTFGESRAQTETVTITPVDRSPAGLHPQTVTRSDGKITLPAGRFRFRYTSEKNDDHSVLQDVRQDCTVRMK